MKFLIFHFLVFTLLFFPNSWAQSSEKEENKTTSPIYSFTVKDIDGKEVKLEEFNSKVVLIVNVASKCGYTPQYKGLQKLYKKYKKQGLVVLGFPANDFGRQEPGTNKEIKAFCASRYQVTFPMFEKISVLGKNKHPLYKFLTGKKTNPKFSGEIPWNFSKFLLNKKGQVVGRFSHRERPLSGKIEKKVQKLLSKK